jgi:hypothetical protein
VDLCAQVAANCPVPLDVMMAAIPERVEAVDQLVDAGISGFSLNIELYSAEAGRVHIRAKQRFSRPGFDAFATRSVERLGRGGAVRSLILIGLEPIEQTIAGVTHLARLGVDPVLSPFRPSQGTKLVTHAPPSTSELEEVLGRSREIVERYGVCLGPRCLMCQHNTLTYPWDVHAHPAATAST